MVYALATMSTAPEVPLRDEVVTSRLEPEMCDKLRKVARRNERTISAEIRIAVREYLEREEGRA